MSKKVAFRFGAFAEPIEQQLKAQGLSMSKANADLWNRRIDAANQLRIPGLLTAGESEKVYGRFMKGIIKDIRDATTDPEVTYDQAR